MKSLFPLVCNYAIKNQEGFFYNGNAYGDHRDFTDKKMYVWRYTEQGAYREKDLFPAMFSTCTIERLTD